MRYHHDDPDRPDCRECHDYRYKRIGRKRYVVCAACSCPACQRLRFVHVDLGGCICNPPEKQMARTVVSG